MCRCFSYHTREHLPGCAAPPSPEETLIFQILLRASTWPGLLAVLSLFWKMKYQIISWCPWLMIFLNVLWKDFLIKSFLRFYMVKAVDFSILNLFLHHNKWLLCNFLFSIHHYSFIYYVIIYLFCNLNKLLGS